MRGGSRILGDGEILIRLGLNLITVRNGRIWDGSLEIAELLSDNDGWSFIWAADIADAERKTKEHSAWKSKQAGREKIYGYATVSVGEIRSITDSAGRPAFLVIATPSKNIPDHITIRRARDYDEEEVKDLRKELADILGDVVFPK